VSYERNYTATKAFSIQDDDDAVKVVERCLKEFHFNDADAKHYQLVVHSTKDDRTFPLLGHEHPLSICLYDRKNNLQTQLRATDGSDSHSCQTQVYRFELRMKKMVFRAGDKSLIPRRQRTPLGNLFRRPQQRSEATEVTPPGRFFGRPLNSLCADGNIPKPIMDLLVYLYENGPFTHGIFRTSGSCRQSRNLRARLDAGDAWNVSELQVHSAASTLKELLRALPDCLLMCDLYQTWIDIMRTRDALERSQKINRQVLLLPTANSLVLRHLLCILFRIAQYSADNQMTSSNLAVCIAPSVLWPLPSVVSADVLTDQPLICKLVDHLITCAREIWPRPEDCLELFEAIIPSSAPSIKVVSNLSDSDEDEYDGDLLEKGLYADNTLLVNDSDADLSHDLSSPASRDSGCPLGTQYHYSRSSSTEDEGGLDTNVSDKLSRLPDILEGQMKIPLAKAAGNVKDRIHKMSKSYSDDSAVCHSSFDERSFHISEPELESNVLNDTTMIPNVRHENESEERHVLAILDEQDQLASHNQSGDMSKSADLRLGQHPLGVVIDTSKPQPADLYEVKVCDMVQEIAGRNSPSGVDLLFRVLEDKGHQKIETPKQSDHMAPNGNEQAAMAQKTLEMTTSKPRRTGSAKSDNRLLSRKALCSDIDGTSSRSQCAENFKLDNKLVASKLHRTDTSKSDSKPAHRTLHQTDGAKYDNKLLLSGQFRCTDIVKSDKHANSHHDVGSRIIIDGSTSRSLPLAVEGFAKSVIVGSEPDLVAKHRHQLRLPQPGQEAPVHQQVKSATKQSGRALLSNQHIDQHLGKKSASGQKVQHKSTSVQWNGHLGSEPMFLAQPKPANLPTVQSGSKMALLTAHGSTSTEAKDQPMSKSMDKQLTQSEHLNPKLREQGSPEIKQVGCLSSAAAYTKFGQLGLISCQNNADCNPQHDKTVSQCLSQTHNTQQGDGSTDTIGFSHVRQRALPAWGPLNHPSVLSRVTLNDTTNGDRKFGGNVPLMQTVFSDNLSGGVIMRHSDLAGISSTGLSIAAPEVHKTPPCICRPQVTVVTVTDNCTIISSRTQEPEVSCQTSPLPCKTYPARSLQTDLADNTRRRQLPHSPVLTQKGDSDGLLQPNVARLRGVYEDKPSEICRSPYYSVSLNLK
jgi:hypothetical protein